MLQNTIVSAPITPLASTQHRGGVIAGAVIGGVILVIIAIVIAVVLKKHLVHRGKLYMDAISVST